MTYTDLGEAATKALLLAAERWPEMRELQAILAPAVADYQRKKAAGAEIGFALAFVRSPEHWKLVHEVVTRLPAEPDFSEEWMANLVESMLNFNDWE